MTGSKFFRIDDWWKSKTAFLLGMVYFFTMWLKITFNQFLFLSFFSILTIIGFAAFGYLCNDFYDRGKDILVGKRNFLLNRSQRFIFFSFFFNTLLIAIAWFFLPKTSFSYSLIAFQFILYFAYSTPVFRLKEKGIWGMICDALYAHAVPVLLAAFTFGLAANFKIKPVSLMMLFLWQFSCGLRNIFIHLWNDREEDFKVGFNNFLYDFDIASFRFSNSLIIFWELVLFVLFLFSIETWWLTASIFVLLVFAICLFVYNRYQYTFIQLENTQWTLFPNMFYEKWLPILMLVMLSGSNSFFLVFIPLHFLFFQKDEAVTIIGFIKVDIIQKWIYIPIRRFFSFCMNYAIYFFFLLIGVNLKDRNQSALEYIKSLFR